MILKYVEYAKFDSYSTYFFVSNNYFFLISSNFVKLSLNSPISCKNGRFKNNDFFMLFDL